MKTHLPIISALVFSFALPALNAQEEIEIQLSLAEVPASFDVSSGAGDLIQQATTGSAIDLLKFPKVVAKSGEIARFNLTREADAGLGPGFTVGFRLQATPQVEGDTISFTADFKEIEFEGFLPGSDAKSPVLTIRQIKNITGSGASDEEHLFFLMNRIEKQTVSEEGKADTFREVEKKMFLLVQMKKA